MKRAFAISGPFKTFKGTYHPLDELPPIPDVPPTAAELLGKVLLVDTDRMPINPDAAAIYRF